MCSIGASIGKTDLARVNCAFNQQINAIEWDELVDDYFGLFSIRAIKSQITSAGSTTTMPLLPKSKFSELTIAIPEIKVQNLFADKIIQIEELKRKISTAIGKSNELRDSLRHIYFESSAE